ncbi:MAG: hypothetical protein IPI67_27655 [Myxococcales bacterium]|nr:hypothetical protein [Myxococcales bacterium]
MKKFGAMVMVAVSAFAVVGSVASDAKACGGEWVPAVEIDHRPEGIARAEKALKKGEHAQAAAMVVRMMPHVKDLKAKKDGTLVARAQRILALAVARNNGALPIGKEIPGYIQGTWIGKTSKDKAANLEWSVAALRKLNDIKKDDAAVQSDLAEALAKVESHRAEAKEILEKLATKDLVSSPEAYAALADLRSQAGDSAGQKLALKRCESMAKTANVCRASA